MSKSRQKFPKRRGLTGYRLHLKKLEFAVNGENQEKGAIVRSAKYLLTKNNENEVYYDKFSEAIKEDYLTQVGPLSASTYSERGEDSYSLFDFYLDTLRLGFILSSSSSKLYTTVYKLKTGREFGEKVLSTIFKKIPELKDIIDINSDSINLFYERFIYSSGFKPNGMKNFSSFFEKIKKEGYLKRNEEKARIFFKKVFDEYKKYGNSFLSEKYHFFSVKTPNSLSIYPILRDSPLKGKTGEEIISFWKLKVDELKIGKITDKIINAGNSLSNYFTHVFLLLHSEDIDSLVEEILEVEEYLGVSIWKDRTLELEKKLGELSEKAKKLPKYPYMEEFGVSNFTEYRRDFEGSIKSWVSNFLNQEKRIQERLKKHLEILGSLDKFFKEDREIPESIQNTYLEIKETLEDALELGEKLDVLLKEERGRDGIDETSVALHKLYSQTLHRLRDLLYKFFQGIFREIFHEMAQDDEKEKLKSILDELELKVKGTESEFAIEVGKKVLKELRKDLEKIPQFPGTAKKKKLARYLHSPGYIRGGIEFLLEEVYQNAYENVKLEKSEQGEEKIDEIIRKKLDTLVGKYAYTSSPVAMQMIEKLFSTLNLSHTYLTSARERVQKGKANEGKREKFFVSPYSRGKYSQLESERTFTFDDLAAMFQLLKIRWNEHLGNEKLKAKDLVSFLELEKIRTSLFLEFLPGSVMENISSRWNDWESDQRFREHEGAYAYYLSQKEKGPQKKNLQKITQMLLASVSGITKLWGKEEFLERYILQYIASHEKTPIVVSNEGKFFLTHAKNQKKGGEGYQTLKGVKKLTEKISTLEQISLKNESEKIPILASKYYFQFLRDSFLIGEKSLKKRFNYEIGEYSLIREDKVKVEFPFKEGARPQFKIEETKLFVSIPFKILIEKKHKKEKKEKNRVLGIDVGEYGLAYAVVEYEEKDGKVKTKLVKKGFLYEPALRKIRDKFFAIQQRQRTGVFGDVSTAVKKVREQAIHTLRNQVHDLVVRYHAVPVYEYSISNFETGSGRVTKIYRSVKKSDVGWENEADKMEIKNTWGLRGKNPKVIGTHLSAFGTSYVCTKCKRSLYNLEDIRVKKEDEGKFGFIRLESPEGELYGYRKTERETPQASIKNYARAPLKEFTEADLGISPEEVKRKRGDSAVFRCPFVDCGHISDADTQAAYIIALKKIAREVFDGEEDFKTIFKENLIQDTIDFDPNII